jgi:hypothetical protein
VVEAWLYSMRDSAQANRVRWRYATYGTANGWRSTCSMSEQRSSSSKERRHMADHLAHDSLVAVTARAATDPAFRKRLLQDPHGAIRELTGVPVPPTLRIKFMERDPKFDTVVVLPDLAPEDGELSESDVASVAGGTNWDCGNPSTTL